MTKSGEETVENYISSDKFAQLWRGLTRNQQRFAVAMLECSSKKEASLAIGLEPQTVYRWSGDVDAVIEMMMEDAAASAYEILKETVIKAAMVRRGGLDSLDEKLRYDAADAIMDRVMGKPTQRQEVTGADGGAIEHSFPTFDKALERIYDDGDG